MNVLQIILLSLLTISACCPPQKVEEPLVVDCNDQIWLYEDELKKQAAAVALDLKRKLDDCRKGRKR